MQLGCRILEVNGISLLRTRYSHITGAIKQRSPTLRLLVQDPGPNDVWDIVSASSEMTHKKLPTPLEGVRPTKGQVLRCILPINEGKVGITIVGSCHDDYGGVFVREVAGDPTSSSLKVGS